MELEGIILAGGKSSRMGTDKGLISYKGLTFAEYLIHTISPFCKQVKINANNKKYEQFGLKVIQDVFHEKGPLGGIYSSLLSCSLDYVLLVPCDMPFISKELINILVDQAIEDEVTFFSFADKWQPLLAIYPKSILSIVKSNIEKEELGVMRLLKSNENKIKINVIEREEIILNCNTKEELEKLYNENNA